MAFFNGWPWTNFQEQNLDWIIRQLKSNTTDIEEVKKQLTEWLSTIDADVQAVLDEWLSDGTIQTMLQNIVSNRVFMAPTLTGFDASVANNGDILQTSGFSVVGDEGWGIYVINNTSGVLVNGQYYFPLYGHTALSYGVICDGVQDNADQLRDALTMTKYIKFKPTDKVTLSKPVTIFNNRHIDGNNCEFYVSNVNTFSNGDAMIVGTGLINVTIENVRFNRQTGVNNFYAISITSSYKIRIRNCEFYNGKGYLIRISGDQDSEFTNIRANNIEGVNGDPGGVLYLQGGSNIVIRDVFADDITDHAVYLDAGSAVSIRDVDISNITQKNSKSNLTNGAVVAVYGDSQRININRIHADDVQTGINVAARDNINPMYINIADCTLMNIRENGISVHGRADTPTQDCYNTISNCFMQGKSGAGQDGISLRNMNRCMVSDCMESKFARYAVELSNVLTTMINNNVAFDCLSGVRVGNLAAASANVINNPTDLICTYATSVSYSGSLENYINCPTSLSCTNPVSAITGNYIRNPAYTAT